MRWAALLAITLGCAGSAGAQTRTPDLTDALNLRQAAFAPSFAGRDLAADITLVKSWPKAVSFASQNFEFDIAPHAALAIGPGGRQAVGGATLTVERKSRGEQALSRLRDLGVADGLSYGDAGRFYFFAAASGQAVGLNMMHGAEGWDRAGWSTDASSSLVGDAQVGVGWRKGDGQASFGVIRREVKGRHMIFGQTTRDDTIAAFTFSIQPGR